MGWLRDAFGKRPAAAPAPAGDGAAQWKARGNAALGAGQLAEAARCYEQGVLADPADASLRLNLGFVLLEQGALQPAVERLQQALDLRRPADAFAHEALFLLGRAQAALGRADDALRSFEAALRAQPDFAPALEEGARLLHQLGRHGDAVPWARRLLALQPSAFHRLVLANQLAHGGGDAEAADLLASVCAEEPGNGEAQALRFRVLFKLARHEEALACAQALLALTGPQAPSFVNLAAALGRLGRLEEALAALDEALRLEPQRRDVLVNRSGLLASLGRIQEALECAQAGLRLYPDDADLHWNLAVDHLLLGQFEAGWKEHEWRPTGPRHTASRFPQPLWRGESLQGRAIFLYGEQGFGDILQFVRYLPLVARQARAVYLQVREPLEPLLARLPERCHLLPQGAALPPVDFHCPLMSLPAVLGGVIPADVPYLHADPARVQAWRDRLPKDALTVGIAWSGRPTHLNDHNRSMSLALFRDAAAEGCRFVTVQPELRDADRQVLAQWPDLLDFGRELRDFADTAALVQALDLVVSVDTSVAHLAGALGKPLWVLLPDPPDWRWMLEREDSPWYPTARLYRQGAARAWPEVLRRVRQDLAALARAR